MRRLALALVLLTVLVPLTEADAQEAGTETRRVVRTATQYRQAIADLSTDESGPHRIVLAADISLRTAVAPPYSSSQPLTIDGDGHTLQGRTAVLLRNEGYARLTVDDLTLHRAASGISWYGSVVVRDSTFRGLGRGYGRIEAGPALSVFPEIGPPVVVTVTDTDFVDLRANAYGAAITVGGSLTASRVRIRGVDGGHSVIWAKGRIRLNQSQVTDNVVHREATITSARRTVELVNSVVAHNARFAVHGRPGPVIQADTTVLIARSFVVDNGRSGVAVHTDDLVARHAFIRHAARDCVITGSVSASRSVASDRSCRFQG